MEIIRVIVVGVGFYIIEVSGSIIIYISEKFLFKNLLVLKLLIDEEIGILK